MNKKNKLIIILITMFISFFACNYKVEASRTSYTGECEYYSFDSYITNSGNIVYPAINGNYVRPYDAATVLTIKKGAKVPTWSFYNKFRGSGDSNSEGVYYSSSLKKENPFSPLSNGTCPGYIKVSVNSEGIKWSEANSNDFFSYIQNQYSSINTSGNVVNGYSINFSNTVFISEFEYSKYEYPQYKEMSFLGNSAYDPRVSALKDISGQVDANVLNDYKKGQQGSTEKYLYLAKYNTWSKKIDSIYENVSSSCGINKFDLDLSKAKEYIDININSTKVSNNNVLTLSTSKKANVSDECYNALNEYVFARDAFDIWFQKVDLWSFEDSFSDEKSQYIKTDFTACLDGEYSCKDRDAFVTEYNNHTLTNEELEYIDNVDFFKFYRFAGNRQNKKAIAYIQLYSYYLNAQDMNPCKKFIDQSNIITSSIDCSVDQSFEFDDRDSCIKKLVELNCKPGPGYDSCVTGTEQGRACQQLENGKYALNKTLDTNQRNWCSCNKIYSECVGKSNKKDDILSCVNSNWKSYCTKQGGSAENCDNEAQQFADEAKNTLDTQEEAYDSNVSSSFIKDNTSGMLDIDTAEGIKCEDIKFLHTIYVVIIILAPTLVVVLGSFDYAMAMISSDEQKMKKFRDKFKTRLIALVLLIIVPFMINLITSFVDLNNGAVSCIVKGE